ncbi:hypothetical protein [Streptomyces sp. NPDC001404]
MRRRRRAEPLLSHESPDGGLARALRLGTADGHLDPAERIVTGPLL